MWAFLPCLDKRKRLVSACQACQECRVSSSGVHSVFTQNRERLWVKGADHRRPGLQVVKISDLNKRTGEGSDGDLEEFLRLHDERVAREKVARERTNKVLAEAWRREAEQKNAPLEMRDVLIDVNQQLVELRSENAKWEKESRWRDRWLIFLTFLILVLTAALLIEVLLG